MSELSLIFMGGLLGSSHCLGMCGGFAILIGANQTSRREMWISQGAYSIGRIFTYSVLGVVAGYVGMHLGHSTSQWVNASAILSFVAGLFLIVQGLKAAGINLWSRGKSPTPQGCLVSPLFRTFFQSRSRFSKFLAGVMTGFLPCGLLYGFLALATASQDLFLGGAIMFAFGLGTVPMMVLAGIGGQLLSGVTRLRLLRTAAWCVVFTGAITIYRGAAFLTLEHTEAVPACPFCTTSQNSTN
ncbi:sulfite exporter TauE/SafE family protein [Thalassoglobus polymorphus]|uniref:Urease accessory protein UreH-like transmembrane domain-containing protein n=1 Tax=Thalassoglobus polymorphus TaxID=2527994 RepID=A0A517QMV0_9PLAN|nr:sulfite exporter TauE/SafE family protein [Thalassoglobus polymorphus]QDT32887.1 hypothetical protein Mal48_21350 [Thalassoglobus polymorphus]